MGIWCSLSNSLFYLDGHKIIIYFFFKSILIIVSTYRQFHKTLPRSSVLVNWISVRFSEMDCMKIYLRIYNIEYIQYTYR